MLRPSAISEWIIRTTKDTIRSTKHNAGVRITKDEARKAAAGVLRLTISLFGLNPLYFTALGRNLIHFHLPPIENFSLFIHAVTRLVVAVPRNLFLCPTRAGE